MVAASWTVIELPLANSTPKVPVMSPVVSKEPATLKLTYPLVMLVAVTVPVLVEFKWNPPLLLAETLDAVVDILLPDVPIVPEPVDKASVSL